MSIGSNRSKSLIRESNRSKSRRGSNMSKSRGGSNRSKKRSRGSNWSKSRERGSNISKSRNREYREVEYGDPQAALETLSLAENRIRSLSDKVTVVVW